MCLRTRCPSRLLIIAALAAELVAQTGGHDIDVYLIGGQSNATGQGYMRNLPEGWKADERVMLFTSGVAKQGGGIFSGQAANTWLPLHQASESPDRFGPELGFGNRMQEQTPGRHVAIIKHAWSGTNLYKDWVPGKDAADTASFGKQFRTFVETVDRGMADLRERGNRPVIRGMTWQQGESDAATAAHEYAANLTHFIARVREQFHVPDLVFVYGYVCPPPGKRQGCEIIRQAQHDLDQDSGSELSVKNAYVVLTDDLSQRADDKDTPLPGDHVHFGSAGTLGLGRRYAEKMFEVLRNTLGAH
jgi:hypothetical protein